MNSTVTTRTRVLSTYWSRSRPSAGLLCEWKNDGSPSLLERSILFFRMHGCWIILTKMAISLSLLAFRRHVVNAIFLKYSKEGSNIWIQNVPLDVYYNDTKHFQKPSEKQGRCKMRGKNSQCRCVKCKVNRYMFWNISWKLANVWLRNVKCENTRISSV